MFSQFKRTAWKATSLAMMLSLVGFTMALAASGALDTTFSGDGKQTTDFAGQWLDEMHAMALQADGKIVAVGERWDPANLEASTHDFALARYKTNGSLDASFSGDGKQLTNFGAVDRAMGVAIQSDGKIVVSGQKCNSSGICDLAVARYNPSGSLDSTFSGDGKQVVVFGSGDNGTQGGLAIQPDGKILIAGYVQNGSGDVDFAVYRLNANGMLDNTFSGDGKVNFGFGTGREDTANDLLLRGGKIVVAGSTCDASDSNCNFAVARLTAAGALDTTFSGDGKQTADFGGDDRGYGVAAQSDGKLVVVGHFNDSATMSSHFALARFMPNGSLDTSINGTGKRTIDFGNFSIGRDVLVAPGGKIVLAGFASNGSNWDFALARLDSNTALDTTFSGDGKVVINFGAHQDFAYSLLRQADGKFVLGGFSWYDTRHDFALARVLP